jgi:predicted transcriptional regulator
MTTLTIRLPEQLRADLTKLSRQEHRAVSDIVRDSLRRHVAVHQ